jgi:hypothetical protein
MRFAPTVYPFVRSLREKDSSVGHFSRLSSAIRWQSIFGVKQIAMISGPERFFEMRRAIFADT